jgi:hypothetical protein
LAEEAGCGGQQFQDRSFVRVYSFIAHGSRLKIPFFASGGEKSHNSLPRKILHTILLKTHGFFKKSFRNLLTQ